MSRGLGCQQRAVVEWLATDEQRRTEGVPFRALRPVLGPDKSNARRVVRSLIRRGKLEVVEGAEGEPRLKLHWLTAAATLWRLAGPYED